MKKMSPALALLTALAMQAWAPAWCADTSTDLEKVQRQASSIPDLLQSAANAAGYPVNSVDIQHTVQHLTLTVVNAKPKDGSESDREPEAMAIASLVEAAIANKPEYAYVDVIRLNFVSRSGQGPDGVETFEFFRTPTQTFALRKG